VFWDQFEQATGIFDRFCGNAPFIPVDGRTVTMLLSLCFYLYAFISQRHKKPNNKGGGHGDRWDRRLLALWDDVH
jgi:hypothetical protein